MPEDKLSSLTDEEQRWINLFYQIDFPWKRQMQEQVASADISRDYYSDVLFLYFAVPLEQRTLPRFSHRVPIEFLVQHIYSFGTEVGKITYDNVRSMNIARNGEDDPYPTSFMLHIFDGAVQELEIYNLDLSVLDRKKMCIGRCDYWISPDFALG